MVPYNLHQMESTISLCYGSLPIAPRRLFPRAMRAARESRAHFRLNHASLSLPHGSTRSFGPVNCMLDRFTMPSKNKDQSDRKIARGMTGISEAMACVLGMFSFSSKMNPKSGTAHAWNPAAAANKPIAGGGDVALESFLRTMKYAPEAPSSSPPELTDLSEYSLNELKLYIVGRSKYDKSYDDLGKALRTEYNALKEELQKKGGEEGNLMELPEENLEIASIELLIFQEKYEEACDRLNKFIAHLYDIHETSDFDEIQQALEDDPFPVFKAEIILYKAIVHTMLYDNEATNWWKAFGNTLGI